MRTNHGLASLRGPQIWRAITLWLLLFLICFGLGYPTLNRYDPRQGGTRDSSQYYRIVVDGPGAVQGHQSFRVLVPYVARPFYRLARDKTGSWDPVFLGLLVANSMFTATTAQLMILVGSRLMQNHAAPLLGACLYLLNFAIPNVRLAGLVDSAEGFFLMALVGALGSGRWWWLAILGVCGALAKESYVPLSVVFAGTWWLFSRDPDHRRWPHAALIVALAASGLATTTIVQSWVSGRVSWPWDFAASLWHRSNYWITLWDSVFDKQSLYIFIWLLPLGLFRLSRFPFPWVMACAVTSLAALCLTTYYAAAPGTLGRTIFSIAGPLLSLAAAETVSGLAPPGRRAT